MKDFNGVELQVGDEVIFTHQYVSLRKSKIFSFGEKMVVIGCKGGPKRYPEDVIKVIPVVDNSIDEDGLLKLDALEQAGVDNWDGYDYAMDAYREMKGEEE